LENDYFSVADDEETHTKQPGIKMQQPLEIRKLEAIAKIFHTLFAAFQSK